jgi:acetylornithine deacetylase/succinyl-diaminopimelate desuccinylase-like protein
MHSAEEVGKRQGAGHIAPFLEERYGKDGVLLIIDEGTGVSDDVSSVVPFLVILCPPADRYH